MELIQDSRVTETDQGVSAMEINQSTLKWKVTNAFLGWNSIEVWVSSSWSLARESIYLKHTKVDKMTSDAMV